MGNLQINGPNSPPNTTKQKKSNVSIWQRINTRLVYTLFKAVSHPSLPITILNQ